MATRRPPLVSRRAVLAGLGTVMAAPALAQSSPWPDPTDPLTTLEDVARAVERVFRVARIETAELAAALAADRVAIVDTRDPEEFALSHLPGAIRVDPDIEADPFLADVAPRLDGKPPVFVCSVGIRSGRLLAALDWELTDFAQPGRCLAGGLFRWVAEGRALTTPDGRAIREVHPKDAYWGALLTRSLAAGR